MSPFDSPLAGLLPPSEYREARSHCFPSQNAFDWFVRCNRTEVLKSGALLKIAGRKMVDPSKMDEVVLNLAKRAA